MSTLQLSHLPFILHLVVEIPAAIAFAFPDRQLRNLQSDTRAVIRQYALLLVATNVIAALFIARPIDELSCQVAGALALYHAAPIIRATSRVVDGEHPFRGSLGGPVVHLLVHILCLGSLGRLWLEGWAPMRIRYERPLPHPPERCK